MTDEQTYSLILARLTEIAGKLDKVSGDVSQLSQAGRDVDRRLSKSEACVEDLQATVGTHATAIDRHDRALATLSKVVLGVAVTVLGALALAALRVLPAMIK